MYPFHILPDRNRFCSNRFFTICRILPDIGQNYIRVSRNASCKVFLVVRRGTRDGSFQRTTCILPMVYPEQTCLNQDYYVSVNRSGPFSLHDCITAAPLFLLPPRHYYNLRRRSSSLLSQLLVGQRGGVLHSNPCC
jgi:hypothetical protein